MDEIVHCAGDTSFSERRRRDVERANLANLENVLSFASLSRCIFFHHVSTAYVAGRRKGIRREEVSDHLEFSNVYEETKHLGEKLTLKRCNENEIRVNIYRPSIVYGDSRSGRTFRFNAMYYPLRVFSIFKDLFLKDILQNGGLKAEKMGIHMGSDGNIHMPIRLSASNGGGINLIPVNFFVDAFLSIMEEDREGGVFHIVNPKTLSIPDIIEYLKRSLQIQGITAVTEESFRAVPRNGLETLFGHYMEAYGPYIKDERVFDSSKTSVILGKSEISCPDFDYEVFSRCLEYALETDWGNKLLVG